ncbi:MAG: LCP family protein [Acidimicrobiales bacterium]
MIGTPAHSARPGPRRRRRTRGHRALVGVNIFLGLCLLFAGGAFAYVKLRLGQIKTVSVAGITAQNVGGPMNVLVVGSDSRAGQPAGAAAHFGSATQVAGQRSDVIIILHVDPHQKQATMLSIPRDMFVPIYPSGAPNKINSAFDQGGGAGAADLVQTIQRNFGISINHFVEVNFAGFQGLVDAVGGINMYFPTQLKDVMSGLNITQTGCVHLNGAAALALARSRDTQYNDHGQFQYDPTGDLGRIQRQHIFLHVLMHKALSAGLSNPITANALVSKAVKDVTIDSSLSTGDILTLAERFKSTNPADVATYTLPTVAKLNYHLNGNNYGDVLLPDQTADQTVISAWSGPTLPSGPAAPAVSPSSVSVQVLNGSGQAGQAASAGAALTSAGFNVSGTGNAPSVGATDTVLSYAPGQEAAAQLLKGDITGPVRLQAGPSSQGANVILTTGTSFGGIQVPPASSGGSSSSSSGSAAGASTLASASPPPTWYDPRAC